MKVIGIVAEYNPFHSGHAYQIQQTKALLGENCAIIVIMSGNWVQSAYPALMDKWLRSQIALSHGADLVFELPTPWAISSAEEFARGSIALLHATGIVDILSFGSECGQIASLLKVAHCLNSTDYQEQIAQQVKGGSSFAHCRQKVVEHLLGQPFSHILETPNNTLGIEYLRALSHLNSTITPITIQRMGAEHNSIVTQPSQHLSATQIRKHILEQNLEPILPFLSSTAQTILSTAPQITKHSLFLFERLMLASLRTMSLDDWSLLPDSGVSEGLPNRLYSAAHAARSLDEFYTMVKTKRYAHSRLRRLALWGFLGLTKQHRLPSPSYLRVLGFNAQGQALLSQMKKTATLPIVTKPAHMKTLSPVAQSLFEAEVRCTDLYDLLSASVPSGGREWTSSVIRVHSPQSDT